MVIAKSGTLSKMAQRRAKYLSKVRGHTGGGGSGSGGARPSSQSQRLAITGVETKQGKIPEQEQVTHVYERTGSGSYRKVGESKSKLVVYPANDKNPAGKTYPAHFYEKNEQGQYKKVGTGVVKYGQPEYRVVKSPFKSQEELDKYAVKDTNKKIRVRDIPSLLYKLDKRRIEMQLGILGRGTVKVTQKFGLHEPPMMTRQAFEKKYPDKSYELYLQRQKGETLIRTTLAGMVETPYTIGASIYGASQFIEKTIKNPRYPKKAIKGAVEEMKYEYEEHPQRFAGKQIGSFIGMSALGFGIQKIASMGTKTQTSASVSELNKVGEGKYVGKGKIVTKTGKKLRKTEVKSILKTTPEGKVTKSYGVHELTTEGKQDIGLTKGISTKTKLKNIYAHLTEGKIISKGKKGLKTTNTAGKYVSKSLNKKYSVHIGETLSESGIKGKTAGFTKVNDISDVMIKSTSYNPLTKTKTNLPKTIYKTHLETLGKGLEPKTSISPYTTGIGLVGSTAPKVLKTPEKQAHFSRVGTIKPKTESRVIKKQQPQFSSMLGTSAERTLKGKQKVKTYSLLTQSQKRLSRAKQKNIEKEVARSFHKAMTTTITQQQPREKVISRTRQATLITPRLIQHLHSGLMNPKKKVVPPFQPAFLNIPLIPETPKSKKSYKPLDWKYMLKVNPVVAEPEELKEFLRRL